MLASLTSAIRSPAAPPQDWRLLHSAEDLASLGRLTRLRKLSFVTPYEEHLSVDGLLALTQLRLHSVSPSPAMARYEQVGDPPGRSQIRIARILAGVLGFGPKSMNNPRIKNPTH